MGARGGKGRRGGVGSGSSGPGPRPCVPGNLEAQNKSEEGQVPRARGLGARLGALSGPPGR